MDKKWYRIDVILRKLHYWYEGFTKANWFYERKTVWFEAESAEQAKNMVFNHYQDWSIQFTESAVCTEETEHKFEPNPAVPGNGMI